MKNKEERKEDGEFERQKRSRDNTTLEKKNNMEKRDEEKEEE